MIQILAAKLGRNHKQNKNWYRNAILNKYYTNIKKKNTGNKYYTSIKKIGNKYYTSIKKIGNKYYTNIKKLGINIIQT